MKKLWQHITASELIAIIAVLVVIVLAIITRQSIFSPGTLSAQTAEEPRGGVFSHQELAGRCGECHAPPWDADTMADRCLDCHTEIMAELQNPHDLHSRVLPVGEPWSCVLDCHTEHKGAYAALTLIPEEHFNRQDRGFSLEGHLVRDDGFAFACVDCHPVAMDVFEEDTCETCHQDREAEFTVIHVDTFGTGCLKCHDGIDTYGEDFNHDEVAFPLMGKHISLPCADCHQGAQTVEALQEAPQDCYSCHRQDDEHNGRAGSDCAQCHDASDWQQPAFNHDETNYPLTGSHFVVACTDCHIGDVYQGTPTDCDSCHSLDDEHQGTASDCTQCHDTSDWKQVNFDHNETDFRLTGEHDNTACIDCHQDNRFVEVPTDCYSCHSRDDEHQRTANDCGQCHNTGDWRQVRFNHDQTSYDLTGRHISATCTDCHLGGRFDNTLTDCYSCHRQDDEHEASETNCTTCHNTSDWRQVNFGHNQTEFPLTGRHSSTDCISCHTDNTFDSISTACHSCHSQDDAHNGSFGAACNQCHNTTDWRQVTFNHSQTAFPLTGAHGSLACNSCHQGDAYAGTPTDCYSCHSQDDAHNGSFGTACNQCHNTTAWLPANIDHSQTNFPLTGAHGSLACNSCHQGDAYAGTPTDCYSCHSQDDTHNGSFGTACDQCHNTTDWIPAQYNLPHTFPVNHYRAGGECAQCHPDNLLTYTCYAGCHEHTVAKMEDKHSGDSDFGDDCARCHPTGRE